jgi:hypothetical protein
MKTEITCTKITTNHGPDSDDWKKSPTRFTVSRESNAIALIESEFAGKHGIYDLPYHSTCWDAVVRASTAAEAAAMEPVLCAEFGLAPGDFTLKFSAKAGCPCGCSPGYIGMLTPAGYSRPSSDKLSRHHLWMDVLVGDGDIANIRAVMAKQAARLPAERIRGEAKVAAEKAVREAQKAKEVEEQAAWEKRRLEREEEYKQMDLRASLNSASL